MICVQNSDMGGRQVLLTSDLPDAQDAALEVGSWLRAHGYQALSNARPLLVYENGVCVREWLQAERQASFPPAALPQSHYRVSFAAWIPFHPPRTV